MQKRGNIILVGPMGSGKTAVGRELAARLGRAFVDVDDEIETLAGKLITAIFADEGEDGFRRRECLALAEALSTPAQVIATGGGAVMDAASRAALVGAGAVVYLRVDPREQLNRVAGDNRRPLLDVANQGQRLADLQAQREAMYLEVADHVFDTSGHTPASAADAVAALLATRGEAGEMSALMRHVEVGGAQPYRISIGPGLLDAGAALAAHLRGRHALIVSDSQVAPLYAARVQAALAKARPDAAIALHVIEAGEASKTLQHFSGVIDALATLGATRDACVYALGGGVVGDLAGFAAACWMRGIDCVQLPTTLLAMVDSSVGGKTAVDIAQGKNLVGAFHPPRAVFVDTSTLRTLPDRELRAGLAETIKYGAIVDAAFLAWLDTHADALLAGDDTLLAEAIARSCTHKAAITERDPFEHGERALLNFGHTFGHAIEAQEAAAGDGYGDGLNHGEAVAVGMLLAARLSAELNMSTRSDTGALQALLQRFGLPTTVPAGLDAGALLARMRLDKKAKASGLRFILWDRPGAARVVADVDEAMVLEVLRNA